VGGAGKDLLGKWRMETKADCLKVIDGGTTWKKINDRITKPGLRTGFGKNWFLYCAIKTLIVYMPL
jgi:hypothetical protein